MDDFDGFVIYSKKDGSFIPFGVTSSNSECHAISNYIPSSIKEALIEIEDVRFFKHRGIDIKAILRALIVNIIVGRIVQGGSTITQQLARNLLKDNSKTIFRKLKESTLALKLERKYSKEEILNLYFNHIYFGKNLRGIRSAGLYYFQKEVNQLSHAQLLFLITILRGPNFYSQNLEQTKRRYLFISKKLTTLNVISNGKFDKLIKNYPQIFCNQLVIVRPASLPFIVERVDDKAKTLFSSINTEIQALVVKNVRESKYPISIIAIRDKKVVAFSSSYGTDYAFTNKTNVGSTLKPFIYCFLREQGINKYEVFPTTYNNLNWDVREASSFKGCLSIDDALYFSNNNVFINASGKVGVEKVLKYLSELLDKPLSSFTLSSLLGATENGISLYELCFVYSTFFSQDINDGIKSDCLKILNNVFRDKLNIDINNVFLKTGTTNNNTERFAVFGNTELTFAVLRNENPMNDYSKDGGFIYEIKKIFSSMFNLQKKGTREWI
ncbi:transglycosylase domain-containing protein [Segatella salivae]|jgi:penicillin-binding protein 1A|uniref:Transglycosylase n=1 Tax=Segatella salivae F0493 TaxID=1395125 RepID=U2MLG7_9BACT|nr:transglycosylase domain-containing protein [Segatella salivae]ERK02515.1 transglycosylase [Segatella salivae F0493]